MLVGYRFVVVLLCVFTFSSSRFLYVVESANSTAESTISQDATRISQEISAEDTSDQDNTNVTITNSTIMNATNSNEITLPSENANATDSKITSGPECVVNRGWFRWKVHLRTGHSYFSSSDCTLKVCNEKGDLDFYSCNRLDAWEVLRPSIDRDVNEGQLQCLKSGCI